MRINEGEFERLVSDTSVMEQARELYSFGVVEAMEIVHIGYDHFYSIKSNVNIEDEKTECHIALNEKGIFTSTHCNCEENEQNFACIHVAVSLLQIESVSPRSFPFYFKQDQRAHWDTIMRNIRQQQEEERLEGLRTESQAFLESLGQIDFKLDMSSVELEASLNAEVGLEVSYKVGHKTKYVIKDIKEFMSMVHHAQKHKYGKNLDLNHAMDNFDEASREQIVFMNRLLSDNSIYDEEAGPKVRSFKLNHATLDAFFDLYSHFTSHYKTFKTFISKDKLSFNIEKNDDYLIVTPQNKLDLHIGKKHLYAFEKDILLRFEMDAFGKGIAFAQHFEKHDSFLIPLSQEQAFYDNVYSVLKDCFDFVGDEIKGAEKEGTIKIYGDIDDFGQIYLSLEGIGFGEETLVGFQDHDNDLMKQIEAIVQSHAYKIENDRAYFDDNSEITLNFFRNGMPQFERYAEVYVSESLKRLGDSRRYSFQVGINVSHNLLEIDFDSVDIPKEELAGVLEAYRKRKKFYKLKDGETISLESKELESVDELLRNHDIDLSTMKDGVVEVDQYRMFSLSELSLDNENIEVSRGQALEDTLDRFKNRENNQKQLPDAYKEILRDYQVQGFDWFTTLIDYGFGGILADDMGLGKTVQMISVIESLDSNKPSIVVCPSSIILNWSDEISKFSKGLKSLCIMGTKLERDELIKDIPDYDVIVTSYDYLRRDVEEYENQDFSCIILDEAQYIKNQKTMNARSVKQLRGDHRFALTGTPIENTLAELWSIFDFLMPGYLHSYAKFSDLYERPIVKENDMEASIELKKLIEPFILRRMKKDVLTELPDKIESTISYEFNDEEKKLYFANLAQVNETLANQAHLNENNSIAVLAMLTRLRQICCEPRSVYQEITEVSSKMLGALDLIERFKENKQKVLLFSSFTSVLDLMAQELDKRGISYYTLTGKTDRQVRRERVNAFQVDDTEVFLISLKAGGTGINLTAAEAVIHFDPWWNVSAQNQATDRAYRIGQHNNVQVFKLIMKDSVEEKIIELQEKKTGLSDAFIENNDGSITSMNHSDILSLFSQD